MESKFLRDTLAELTSDSDIDLDAADHLIDSGARIAGAEREPARCCDTQKHHGPESEPASALVRRIGDAVRHDLGM